MPYGQDTSPVVGGYGQDAEAPAAQGSASQWGPIQEGVNAAMFGTGPALDEWLGKHAPSWMTQGHQPSAAAEQANANAYKAENPKMAMGADLVGGSIPFMAAGGLGPAGVLARAMTMGGVGAAGNAAGAAANGQDPVTAGMAGAMVGAGGEVGGSMLAAPVGKLADAIMNRGVNVPASSALKSLSNSQYDGLQTGVNATQNAVMPLHEGAQFGQDVLDKLNSKWLGETTAAREFGKFTSPPQGATSVNASGLEAARQNLNAIIRQSPGTPDAAAAAVGKQSIDDLVKAKAASNPAWAQFASDAADARGNWRAAKTSDIVTNNIDRATGQASTNLADNRSQLISKRANAILQQPKLSGGMSPDELSALEGLRSGSPLRNAAQGLGAATGHTGIGLAVAAPELGMQIMEHGFSPHVMLPAAGAMAAGMGAHRLANALAESQGRGVASLIRSNSPMFRDAVASGASAAPVDVGPTTEAARRLAAAMAGSGGSSYLQQGQQ